MEANKYTVTAFGKNRVDVLNRITLLYLQRNIQVESFVLSQTGNGESKYQICAEATESAITRIVNLMNNIVELNQVQYALTK